VFPVISCRGGAKGAGVLPVISCRGAATGADGNAEERGAEGRGAGGAGRGSGFAAAGPFAPANAGGEPGDAGGAPPLPLDSDVAAPLTGTGPGLTVEDSLSEGGIPELVTAKARVCAGSEIASTLAGLFGVEKTSAVPMRILDACSVRESASLFGKIALSFHCGAGSEPAWFADRTFAPRVIGRQQREPSRHSLAARPSRAFPAFCARARFDRASAGAFC